MPTTNARFVIAIILLLPGQEIFIFIGVTDWA
jgi:hypothetical protein